MTDAAATASTGPRFSIRAKLLALALFLVALLLLQAGVALDRLAETAGEIDRIDRILLPMDSAADDLLLLDEAKRDALLGVRDDGTVPEALRDAAASAGRRTAGLASRLDALVFRWRAAGDAAAHGGLLDAAAQVAASAAVDSAAWSALAEDPADAGRIAAARSSAAKLRSEAEQVAERLLQVTRTAADRASSHQATALHLSMGIAATALALGLLAALRFSAALARPIRHLAEKAGRVQQGELDIAVEATSRDEVGDLAHAFNHMVSGLRLKERIRATFGRYMDPRVVEQVLADGDAAMVTRRQVMTVSFLDMAGFTSLAEGLRPDELVELLNRFLTEMSRPVAEAGGVIDKFIGDAVMAYFGPPFLAEGVDHAACAYRAALAQQAALRVLNAELSARFGRPFDIRARIGIATGPVVVGSIGSATSRSFTVIGDEVNVASRIEAANKIYGTRILAAGPELERAGGGGLTVREIDKVALRGRSAPTRLFELCGPAERAPDALLAAYAEGLDAYRAGDFQLAWQRFRRCLDLAPDDRPAQIMLQRLDLFALEPPLEWDGTWHLTDVS